MPLIRIRDLKVGTDTETRFAGEYDKRYIVRAGDLLIGMDGEFGCYEWRGGPALLNQRVCRLKSFSPELSPRFLFYGVNSHLKAIEDVTTYATVKHLSSKQILEIDFFLPPLSEQARIVRILDAALDGIVTASTNVEESAKNSRSIFENYLEATFDPSKTDWACARLGDVAKTQYGLSLPMNEKGKGFKIFRMGDIRDAQLVDTGRMKFADIGRTEFEKYKLRVGDVLFNRTNSFDLVGKTGIFSLPGDYCFASYLIRVVPNTSVLLPDFLNFYMNTELFRSSIKKKASKSINQANINATILANEPVRYPRSLSEQRSIIEHLMKLREETRKLTSLYAEKLATLSSLRGSLLHHAFSGAL